MITKERQQLEQVFQVAIFADSCKLEYTENVSNWSTQMKVNNLEQVFQVANWVQRKLEIGVHKECVRNKTKNINEP